MAYLLSFSRFRGRSLVEAVFALPIVLPPTVLGFFVLVAIGNLSPLGRLYTDIFGTTMAFSFTGLVVASVLYSFPFALQPIQNAFEAVDKGLIESSRTLGCTRLKSFFRVLLPASRKGLITGAMLAFAHTSESSGLYLWSEEAYPARPRSQVSPYTKT